MTESEIVALIEQKLEPLRIEIRALQEKLGIDQELPTEPVSSQSEPISSQAELPEVAPERADFQRFLQRGLEQEQLEYTEESVADKPATKKGWNPFKR